MKRIEVNSDRLLYTISEQEAALKCLKDKESSIFVGNTVRKFEEKLSNYLETNYSLTFPNCTLSIYAALQVLGIKRNDEVIVPNLTHASSIYPIIMSGGKIKVCDFMPNSYNLNLSHAEKLISPQTKYFLVCYLYGMPLNVKEIKDFCVKHKLIMIEDAAQAFGLKIGNMLAGTYGDVGCFSFNDTKMLRIGEGGAICTNNEDYYLNLESFRHVGEIFTSSKKSSVSSNTTYRDLLFNGLSNYGKGLNLRPTPINFAIGLEKLNKIDKIIENRRKKLQLYYKNINLSNDIQFIDNFNINNLNSTSPLSAWILLNPKKYDRNKIIVGLLNMGVPVGSFNYNTIIKNEYFKKFIVNRNEKLINSQQIRDNSIFLPLYESISLKDIVQISKAFNYVVQNYNNNIEIFDDEFLDNEIDYFDGFYLKRSLNE